MAATAVAPVVNITPGPITPPSPFVTQTIQPAATGQPKNIKSFFSEKKPKNDLQSAAVMAYFCRFEATQAERKEALSAKDLQEASRQARGYVFKDPLKTLNNAVASGYFDRAGRGEFKLNAVGENLVAMTLPGTSGSENSGSRRKRPRQTKKRKPSK